MRRWIVSAALCLPLLAQALTLRDDRGTEHRFDTPPKRIVSLLPSLTESVCALGACERLVGVDRYSDWPARVRTLPQLGGLDDANVERIVALRPEVVLASRSARVSERLEALGIEVVALESDSHADVRRSLRLLATMLGAPEQGTRLWAGIEAEIAAAATRVPARLRGRRVYFEVDGSPYAAGATSFIGQTLARLGLVNLLPPELGPFPKLNPEYLVRHPPDIVMATQRDAATMAARPGWAALKALQQHQVCGFDETHYELLIRPGPRLGEAARTIADCLAALPG